MNFRWAARAPATGLLVAYTALALILAGARLYRGDGAWWVLAAYAALLTVALGAKSSGSTKAAVLERWLPLLALPVLYAAVPWTAVSTQMRDASIQPIDRVLFGSDVAQTFAGTMPRAWVSEILHAAYLSYYAIIYLPPVLMQVRNAAEAFDRTVLGFTIAMVGCFLVFCVYPVEGPRYAWPPPAGIPAGPVRSFVLGILAGGSSRGTAFPSSHQAIALVMSLSSMAWDRRLGWVMMTATVLLGLGAVYGGFHYGTDMLAGAAVGAAASAAARRWLLEGRARLNPYGALG